MSAVYGTRPGKEPAGGLLDDGFGSCWQKCDRADCGLEVVRPGSVQCWCDDDSDPEETS